jgi:NADPH:quinone reductase-like Zn-dependent oxidoreductase
MKAWIIEEFGGRDRMVLTDVEDPEPGEGEVLIRVRAVGVNPVDWKIREGFLKDLFPHRFPIILGWDVAGEIEAVGHSARRFRPGDEVFAYARRPVIQNGTYAEKIALPESYITRRPEGTSWEESASLPLTGLTAFQSVYTAGRLRKGESVLILGASGGVGSCAVQFARSLECRVFAVAGKQNHDYLESIGAEMAIDYAEGDFSKKILDRISGGVDLVFDCIGGDSLEIGARCARQGGRLVSITSPDAGEMAGPAGLDFRFVFVEPNVRQLDHIHRLIREGAFRPNVTGVFDFADAPEAHAQIETGHTRGKIVLKL